MTTDTPLSVLIARRARLAATTDDAADLETTIGELVERSVLRAFGCSCPPQAEDTPIGVAAGCLLHGSLRSARRDDEPTMPSQAVDWENDPYYDYTSEEHRDDVQAKFRTAAEFVRAFRSTLHPATERAQLALNNLNLALEHAGFNGGMTARELELAETATAAIRYALRLLYVASNHVGDKPDADQVS